MRRLTVVLLSGLALAGSVVVAAPAASADVPSAPYTALGFTRSAISGEYGGAETFAGDAVTRHDITPTSAEIEADPGDIEGLHVEPPTGATFTAGTAFAVAATADSQHGTGHITALNRGCGQFTSGTVSVLEAVTADDGTVTSFAADVDVVCADVHFVAFARYNSSVGYAGVALDKPRLDYGTAPLDAPPTRTLSVSLSATGSETLPTISGTSIGGDDPSAFHVVADGCKGTALAPGTSCTVTVRARPAVAGTANATLVFGHDGAAPYEVALTAAATDVAQGTYRALTPQRAFDTRNGTGVRRGPIPGGGVLRVPLGRFLPGPASAVVLNLTVALPTRPSYLTAYPTGTTRPTASSMNFPAGWQGANLVTVPLGVGNQIDIYNYNGDTPVLGDIVGYYASGDGDRANGGGYHPVLVERLLDTRGPDFGQPLPGGYEVSIPVRYSNDQGRIAALSVTITAVRPRGTGFLTAWNNGPQVPGTSTLNFNSKTGVISNSAIVPVSYSDPSGCPGCAFIAVANQSAQPTDVVVDINGYFDDGGLPAQVRYQSLSSPTRIVDTRIAQGTTTFASNTTRTVAAPTSIAGYDTFALDSNITAVLPKANTYVTVWPGFQGQNRPIASVLNPNAGQTIADHAIVGLNYGNTFNLYNYNGVNNLLVDVSGTFALFPSTPADQIPRGNARAAAVPHAAAAQPRNVATAGPAAHRL